MLLSGFISPLSMRTSPRTSWSISREIYPGRSTTGTSSVKSTIVDSRPIPTGPPSMIISMASPRSSSTCCAVVGLGRPEVLALGAATYPLDARIKAAAMGSLGKRTATLSSPPVVSRGTRSDFSKIMVRGPGQNFLARIFAFSGTLFTMGASASISAICTIRGLSEGRPLAA